MIISNNIEGVKEFIIKCLDEKKATEIVVIDLREKYKIADYIICVSGRSPKNVGAIAEYVLLQLKKELNISSHVEGMDQSEWVLIDVGSILVNVFCPEVRNYYKLEDLWKSK